MGSGSCWQRGSVTSGVFWVTLTLLVVGVLSEARLFLSVALFSALVLALMTILIIFLAPVRLVLDGVGQAFANFVDGCGVEALHP